jgi:hypothetical protein
MQDESKEDTIYYIGGYLDATSTLNTPLQREITYFVFEVDKKTAQRSKAILEETEELHVRERREFLRTGDLARSLRSSRSALAALEEESRGLLKGKPVGYFTTDKKLYEKGDSLEKAQLPNLSKVWTGRTSKQRAKETLS